MPRPRRARALALAALAAGAAAACGEPAGPDAAKDLAGAWAGSAGAHELDLRLRYDSLILRSFTGDTIYSVSVKARGTYRDRATGEALPVDGGSEETRPGTRDVTVSLLNRPVAGAAYMVQYSFSGRLADRATLAGWLVMTTPRTAFGPPGSGAQERRESVALTLRRR